MLKSLINAHSFDEGEGHFHESSGHKKGGKKKEGHSKSAKHHDHFSKKGSSKKGSHHDEDQGHKHEDGHEEHYGHKEEHGKKGNLIKSSSSYFLYLLTLRVFMQVEATIIRNGDIKRQKEERDTNYVVKERK